MYYLRDGLRSPALAWIFAFVAARGRADDDAVHAAELDRAGREHACSAIPKVVVGDRRSRC